MTEKQPAATHPKEASPRHLGRAAGHRPARARRRHRAGRLRPRRDRPRRGRGVLQHRHDRLPGNPHRSLLCRADHHLHLPAYRQCRHQRGRHRDRQHGGDAGRARRGAAHRDHRSRRATAPRAISTNGSRPRHHRALRHRHPRAHQPDPRQGHAERGDRARAVGQVRSRRAQEGSARMAGPGRHGPGADGDLGPALHLGRDGVGMGQGLRPAGRAAIPRGRHRLRHQAQHPAPARRQGLQGDGGAGARPRPRTSSRSSPTASSSPTAPAIRRRPANMPCR